MGYREQFLGFEGRLKRTDFWVCMICITLLSLCLNFAGAVLMSLPLDGMVHHPTVGSAVIVLLLWPMLAVLTKRGHDRGRPMTWTVATLLTLNVLGVLVMAASWPAYPMYLAVMAYAFVDYGVLPGASGDNRYGPPPGVVERPAPPM